MADQVVIKPDPEAGSPLLDDDEEDAADLEFYDHNIPGDPMGTMYLARLPHNLWKVWNELDDEAEIQIGTLRQWNVMEDGKPKAKLQLLLNSDLAQHQDVPKEYNLQVDDLNVTNTFVFSEQDLPGYAARNKAKADALRDGIPTWALNPNKEKGNTTQTWDRKKRGGIPPRKSIPKKTTIAGRIRHELTGAPLDNIETETIMQRQMQEAARPKYTTAIVESGQFNPHNIIQAGTQAAHDAFDGFIKTAPKVEKTKKMDNKTARMPENELIDLIHNCFTEYKYHSMKSLRARLRQPEAYLRETLDKVANLNRTGPFANLYSLKPEFREMAMQNSGNALPEENTVAPVGEEGAEPLDDEDEDIKMEDVLP